MTALLFVVLSGILIWLGRWGRSQARALVPSHLPENECTRREHTLRRGAVACQATAVLLLAAAASTRLG